MQAVATATFSPPTALAVSQAAGVMTAVVATAAAMVVADAARVAAGCSIMAKCAFSFLA